VSCRCERCGSWSSGLGFARNNAKFEFGTAKYPQALTARDQLPHALAELPVKTIIEVKRAIATALQTALTTTQPIGPILAEGRIRVDDILK
jgi:sn-glycerol 3-phosphate transport system substrate-binding protein